MAFIWLVLRSAAVLGSVVACGCGNPGPPSPPSLLLPQPAGDLTAVRIGDTVTLRWTMPERSTERVTLRGSQRAAVCRELEGSACAPIGTAFAGPGVPGEFHDVLPPALGAGAPRLLTYRVRLENRHGADAGPSNPAYAAAGFAPSPVFAASAGATPEGVAVRWVHPQAPVFTSGRAFARLLRTEDLPENAPHAPPLALESALRPDWSPSATLDRGAAVGGRYRYSIALVERLSLAGHVLEVQGSSAAAPEIVVQDTFPPGAPAALAAAADADAGAIDLSWVPNSEPDLLGYFVYRRALPHGQAARVSGPKPIPEPGWSDPAAARGIRYGYTVSAVDRSGNESARSRESVEMLP